MSAYPSILNVSPNLQPSCGLRVGKLRRLASTAFSLIELLTVMAIISVLSVAMVPALNSLKGGGSMTKAASDISGLLEQARIYAMANNTYVYVGLQEVDAVQPSSDDGVGRIVIAAVASRDGTRPYSVLQGFPSISTNLVSISKVQYVDAHMVKASLLQNGDVMVNRPQASVDIGSSNSTASFQWPLTSTAKQKFRKVVEFDSKGVPRVQTSTSFSPAVSSYIEIPLVEAHGNTSMQSLANQVAIQIDGVTGAVRVFRP